MIGDAKGAGHESLIELKNAKRPIELIRKQ